MYSCLRPGLNFSRQLFICNRSYFSVLSPVNDKLSNKNGTEKAAFKKIYKPSQIQHRYLSLESVHSLYDSIYASEVNKLATNLLIETHDFIGLPWWATILAASVLMKSFVGFPCAVYQRYLLARIEQTQLEHNANVPKLQKDVFNKAVRGQWTKKKFELQLRKELLYHWKILVVKNNCHPFKFTILFFAQLPFWMLLSFAIRTLTLDVNSNKSVHPLQTFQFQSEGFLWCENLLLADPTFILPALNCLSMLGLIEVSTFSKITKKNVSKNFTSVTVNKFVQYFMRLFAVLFFFVSSVSPSALSLFWTSSSLFALAQNLLLLSPRIRRLFKIPKVPSEVDQPYRVGFNNIVDKFSKVFHWKK